MLSLRPANKKDAAVILELIHALADYERDPNAVVATEADLLRDGFPEQGAPRFHVIIAEWNGKAAGFAFYFFNYSTWLGKPGLYLEDLFVKPEARGHGIGKALLQRLAQIAVESNCYGMRWQVLDWNQPAIDFYERLGARNMKEWYTYRLMGDALLQLARSGAKP